MDRHQLRLAVEFALNKTSQSLLYKLGVTVVLMIFAAMFLTILALSNKPWTTVVLSTRAKQQRPQRKNRYLPLATNTGLLDKPHEGCWYFFLLQHRHQPTLRDAISRRREMIHLTGVARDHGALSCLQRSCYSAQDVVSLSLPSTAFECICGRLLELSAEIVFQSKSRIWCSSMVVRHLPVWSTYSHWWYVQNVFSF